MSDEKVEAADTGTSSANLRTPPYVSFATLLTFLKAMKTDGVPPQIDRSVLGKLSGGIQGQMKLALRSLGLMEGDKPTEAMKQMVDAYDSPNFETVLHNRLRATYPYVFDLDLKTATPTMFAEAFKVTGAKEDVLRKCRTFFLHAAKRAGVQLGSRIATGSVPRGPSNNGAKRKSKATKAADVPSSHASASNGTSKVQSGIAETLLAKFPAFDPKWPDPIKAEWFKNFNTFMGIAIPMPSQSDDGP